MTRRIFILITGLCLFYSGVFSQNHFAGLRTSGTKIVDGNNQSVLLRGIGLGNWLVPEGYMMGTSGFANSPTEINNAIATLIGQSNTDQFFQRFRDNYVTRKDVDQIAQWGFNSIRVPMHYALFTPKDQPYVYIQEGFSRIDSLLSWCEASHLYLILDLHCAPGGQNEGNISDFTGYPSLWEDAQNQERTVDLWQVIAQRYANKEWIGGYDVLNETAFDFSTRLHQSNNRPLHDLLVSITNAIRQVDTNHIIFVEGNWYATDFTGLTPPWDANMVYSFHKYWNSADQGSINYLISLRASTNRPLWLGESGENSNDWFAGCVDLMEKNTIGWAWWPYKKLESESGLLSIKKNPEYDLLLRYWNNQTSKPTVSYAVDALNKFAARCVIDSCVFNLDVVDALMRASHTNATIPFAENKIPGIIYAVNYDMGRNGFAYWDTDYQAVGGNGGTAWNSGWIYRNDGVDIERCSDLTTNGYDVGWINVNEWMNYTVTVARRSKYRIIVKVASNTGGGSLALQWDGNALFNAVDVSTTGGWQKWQEIDCGEYQLQSGKHTLTARMVNNGFNLNYFSFVDTAPADTATSQGIELSQNYPNPFKLSTTITCRTPQDGLVTLHLFDVLGREVAVLEKGVLPAGEYSFVIDTKELRLSSGIYFYQINCNGQVSKRMKAVVVK